MKLYLKFHRDPTSESLSRLHLSSNSIHGILKDRGVLDEAGVRVFNVSQGIFTESFIKIQTSGSLSLLHLSTKSLSGVLEERDVLDGAGDGVRALRIPLGSFAESFIKIHYQEPSQDSKCQLSIFLESRRTGSFLMILEMEFCIVLE